MQEPISTWLTGIPATWRTGITLPGLCGAAVSGSRLLKSTSTILSYAASGSGSSSTHCSSRPCAARKRRVSASEGKTDVVTPISAPIFVIVARSGTLNVATPGPPYSNIQPTLPLVEKISSILRITSLALTQGCNCPVSFTRQTWGYVM